MSDVFDHCLDAHESRDSGWAETTKDFSNLYTTNPLYYHTKVKFKQITRSTEKAVCLDGKWVPKKLCRKWQETEEGKTVYILTKFVAQLVNVERV